MSAAFAVVLAAGFLAIVLTMLIRRKLREKYAILWIVIGLALLVLGLFPELLTWLAKTLGVQVPSNLLFALSIVLLVGVALHQSWELSRAEERIRRLAEEVAVMTGPGPHHGDEIQRPDDGR